MRRHAERKDDQSKFPLVKFRGGWFLFAGGVGLSFVAALILRTVLSPAQIRYWVDGAIVNAKLPVKIEFKDVRVEFAEGWMPWLGLVAEDVSVLTNEACSSGFEFKSKDLRLSFSLRSLFRQQFLVHALDLGESQVRSLAPECDNSNQGLVPSKKFPTEAGSSQVLNSVGSLPPLKREKIEKLRDQFLKVLNQVQHDVMAKMESLRISSLEIVDSRLSEWVLVFRDLQLGSEVRDGQHGISMGGGLKMEWVGPNQEYASSGLGTTLLFESFLSPVSSKISISGNYKEGSIYWETLVNWKDLETSFSLDHQQLPLGPLLPFLQNQKIVTEDIQPKYLWLSCKLGFSGKILDLNSTPLWIEPCEIRGDIGRVSAIKWGWYLFRQPAFDSFEVDLDEIDLRKLMAVFQRVGPSGILSRFGYLNGHIKVNSPQDISLTGEVRDLEMAFSNRGLRGKQLVPFLKGGLLYKNNRISGILSDMELFGGEFKGQMTFNMDPSFRDGALQVAIDRLQFNESIQKLMTGGELNQLSIYGQGKIEKGDLRVWQGDVG
ncbi:MAG: hypothetical protein KDD35_09950, partial [Bdellovibrionales bacterium]|nr:hypothetical protein [Bdellovibrionales bacterium]